jgi:hypothetical protein
MAMFRLGTPADLAEGRTYVAERNDLVVGFAAWQEPALFATELRAAFRSLR